MDDNNKRNYLTPDPDSALETGISRVLITGVIISMICELAGIAMFYIQYHSFSVTHDSQVFIQGSDFFNLIYKLASGSYTTRASLYLMTTGLVMLILTPFIRVVLSLFYFARVKNAAYIWITLFVLVVITVSLALH